MIIREFLTLMPKVHVFECHNFTSFLVTTAVHLTKTSLTYQLLFFILIDNLTCVEIASLVIIVKDVPISQIKHIIIVKEDSLGRINT